MHLSRTYTKYNASAQSYTRKGKMKLVTFSIKEIHAIHSEVILKQKLFITDDRKITSEQSQCSGSL